MPSFENLANTLFGSKRAETNSVLHDGETHTIIGTATGDSADGSVMVELSSDVTNPEELTIGDETYFSDASTSVELPTTEAVKEGDEVLVSIYGGTPLRSPVVTGVVGSGDRVAADAEAAREIAEATGQHFWDDDNGAHVTELPREEWETQQTGPNSLWNSLGMLFRDGLNNLLAIVTGQNSGLQIFDGQGNDDENIVASFSSNGAQIGYTSDYHTVVDSLGLSVYAPGASSPSLNVGGFGMDIEGANGVVSFNVANTWGVPRIYSGAGLQMMNGFYSQMGTFYPLAGFTVEPIGDNTSTIAGEYLHLLHFDEDTRAVTEGTFAMADVIAALTQDHGTITLTNASTTRAHECFRRGWTIQCNITTFHLNAALATGRNVTIGTIPAGFRPSVGTFEAPYCNNSTYAGRVFVSAGTDGNIVLFNFSGSSLPTSVTFTASFTYILN